MPVTMKCPRCGLPRSGKEDVLRVEDNREIKIYYECGSFVTLKFRGAIRLSNEFTHGCKNVKKEIKW